MYKDFMIRICMYDPAFSSDSAVGAIKKIAEEEVKKQRGLELAEVTSIYPHSNGSDNDNYECDVKIKNGGNELRKVPVVTSHIGFAHVPNIGDLVLIGYIGGSVNSPVIMGSLYNDDQRPPVNDAGEIVYESPDPGNSSPRRLYIKFPSGIALTITDDEIKAEAGGTTLHVKLDGDIEITSNAKLTITAQGETKITSKDDMSFSANNIKMESQGSLELKSGASFKAETSGVMDLIGSIVKIN